VFSEPQDEKMLALVLRVHSLSTIALKKCHQMTDDLTPHFFEVSHLLATCLKFKHEVKPVLSPYKEVYKDVEKSEHLKMTCYLTKSFLYPCAVPSVFSNHCGNF
jgi:hypothetical protein